MAEKKVSATTMNILYNTTTSGVNIYTTYNVNDLVGEYNGEVISSSSITPTTQSTSITHRLTVNFNENTSTSERIGYLSIKKGNKEVGKLTVFQTGKEEPTEKYFKWNESSDSAITITHDYTQGEELIAYDTNYDASELGFVPTATTVMTNPAILDHNNSFSFGFDENTGTTQRQETVNIVRKSDSGVVGTLTFVQTGKEEPIEKYFKWENDVTAITITHDYTSGEELIAYNTNYEQNEFGFLPTTTYIKSPTILYHQNKFSFSFEENTDTTQRQETVNIVRTSDSGILATLTFVQTGKEEPIDYYFIWNETQTSAYTSTLADSFTSLTASYDTNYENITFIPQSSDITYRVDTQQQITALFSANTGTTEKVMTIDVYDNNTLVGYLTITQEAPSIEYYFYWDETQTSEITSRVNSATTSTSKSYTTNYENITFTYGDFITGLTDNNNIVEVSFDENPEGSELRKTVIKAISDGEEIGTYTIVQESGEEKYFYWDETQLPSIEVQVESSDTIVSKSYSTNYDNISFNYDEWITNVNDINNEATVNFETNSVGSSSRTKTIIVLSNNKEIGTFTLKQKAGEDIYFYWVETNSSAITVNDIEWDTTYLSKECRTNIPLITFGLDETITGASINASNTFITASFGENPSSLSRYGTLQIKYDSTIYGQMDISQKMREYIFKWDETDSDSYFADVTNTTTSFTAYYTTDYPNVTFSAETGITAVEPIGETGVTIRFDANTGFESKELRLYPMSLGRTIGLLKVTQAGTAPYFYWTETNESGLTANVDSADTSVMKAYTTNYENITFTYDEWITDVENIIPNVKVSFEENPVGASARTKTINVLSDGTTIGTMTIRQSPGEDIYFYWVETNSSAITINDIEWDTTYLSKECRTNIPLITFGLDETITGASINASNTYVTSDFGENSSMDTRYGTLETKYGSTVYGQMNISQKMRKYIFKWDETDDSSYFADVTNTTTSFTAYFTTDFPNISFSAETGITAVEPIGETGVQIRFNANTTTEPIELRLNVISLGNIIGLLKIIQAAEQPYFYWVDNHDSEITADVSSASTQITKSYSTNISGLYFEKNGMVDSISNNNNMITAAYSANTTTSIRTGYVNVYNGNDLVGVFNITQDAERYFYWDETQTSSISATAGADVNYVTKACTTNMTAFTFSGSDIVTGGSVNAANTYITGLFTVNPYFYSRTGVLTIKDGNEDVGYMNITQNAKTHTFKFDKNDSDTLRVTVNSATTSYTATYTTDYDNINYTCEDCTAEQVGQNEVKAKFTVNNTGVERWLRVYIKSSETTIGLLWIIQEG